MGERVYTVMDYKGRTHEIQFSEIDDRWGCLCTFPHNDEFFGILKDRAADLALFGAAVVLTCIGEIDDDVVFLPHDVPEWIQLGIREAIDGESLDRG